MRRVVRCLVAVVVVVDGALAATVDDDPLHQPGCRQAIAALQAAEASASAPPGVSARSATAGLAASRSVTAGPAVSRSVTAGAAASRATPAIDPRLAAARRDVARNCLAASADPPRPGRVAEPPLVVPPVGGTRSPLPPASSAATQPERIAPVAAPVAITSCDSGGCWTSDGSRLQRLGPTLWGPRGACSVVGAVVRCP
jgi:hypothetical protein